jgi:N-acetylneuraminic acid mutarotase
MKRLAAMAAFGLAVLAGVAVLARGLPSLDDESGSAAGIRPCDRRASELALPLGVESPAGRWQPLPPFPIARDELRAESLGGSIYVGSGLRQPRPGSELVSTDDLYAFDPRRSSYRRLPPLPRRVDHPALVAAGGDLYLIGGYRDWQPTGEAFRYSPITGRWAKLASMAVPRGSPAGAAIGGRIYVVGGSTTVGTAAEASKVLEILDLATGQWSRGPDMTTAKEHAGAAAAGGALYVVGGRRGQNQALAEAERFDPRTDRWRPIPPLPVGVGGVAVVGAGGRVIAIGGGDDFERWVTPGTWSFDPSRGRWERLADLRVARHGHAAAALNGELYVFGGAPCADYGLTDAVEALTLENAGSGRG